MQKPAFFAAPAASFCSASLFVRSVAATSDAAAAAVAALPASAWAHVPSLPSTDALSFRAHALISSRVHLPALQNPALFALADACCMSFFGFVCRASAMRRHEATSLSAFLLAVSALASSAFLHTVGHTEGTISLAIAPSGSGSCLPFSSAHVRSSFAEHLLAMQKPAFFAAPAASFCSASLFVRSVAAASDAAAAAVAALPASALA